MRQIILVTGAASSGKSEWAETLAMQQDKPVTYVATAQIHPEDIEWQAKIEKHRLRRPGSWQTLVTQEDLATVIYSATSEHCLLVDSLGTWVANLLSQDNSLWERTQAELLTSLQHSRTNVIFVAEETGWGVVPAYQTGRQFRDRLGKLSRYIGAMANTVYLVTGGHALNVTALGTPLPSPEVFD